MKLNSRLFKLLRSMARSVALPARSLIQPVNYRMVPDYSRGLNTDGTPKMVPFNFPGTATNDPETQRGRYRKAKQALRAI